MGSKSSKESTEAKTSSKRCSERETVIDKFKRERTESAIRLLDPASGIEAFVPALEQIENSTIIARRDPKRPQVSKTISEDLVVVRTDSEAALRTIHSRAASSETATSEPDTSISIRSSSSSGLSLVFSVARVSRLQIEML